MPILNFQRIWIDIFNCSDRCLLTEKCHRDWLAQPTLNSINAPWRRVSSRIQIVKVILLYKTDRDDFVVDYHHVFLLTSFSNVFQTVAYLQLTDYFKVIKLFYNIQYSFREDHSKESASLELIKRIIRELDNKRNPICIYIYIYMDLSKIFNKVIIIIYSWTN